AVPTRRYSLSLHVALPICSDSSTDQVRLSWAMSGFGIMLGIEDPRDRWGSSLSTSYNMPDLIAAVTASQGTWDGKLSVGFADTRSEVHTSELQLRDTLVCR